MPRRRDLADRDRRSSNLSLDRLLGPRIALAWLGRSAARPAPPAT